MEPNIPSPVCRKDGVEIHAAVPKDITEAFSVSWGALFLAEAITRGPLPESEIAQVRAFAALPSALTYPTIQPVLHACAEKYLRGGALENAPLFRAPVRKGERP